MHCRCVTDYNEQFLLQKQKNQITLQNNSFVPMHFLNKLFNMITLDMSKYFIGPKIVSFFQNKKFNVLNPFSS